MTLPSIRTLFILTADDPYPPLSGALLRNWQHINIMMKFGSVGIFSVFEGNPNCQTHPGIDLWRNYNLTEVERSLWEKLKLQLGWLNPRICNGATERYIKTIAQDLKEVLA